MSKWRGEAFVQRKPNRLLRCEQCLLEVSVYQRAGAKPQRFCSVSCKQKGNHNSIWAGNEASEDSGRGRARRAYPSLGVCQCGAKAIDRHHIDGNTANNDPSNVAGLCRRCHMTLDGRIEVLRRRAMKLTPELVAEMRAVFALGGVTKVQMAQRYGVSKSTAGRVLLGQHWPDVCAGIREPSHACYPRKARPEVTE